MKWWTKLKAVSTTWEEWAIYNDKDGCVATITVSSDSHSGFAEEIVQGLNAIKAHEDVRSPGKAEVVGSNPAGGSILDHVEDALRDGAVFKARIV